MPIPAVVARQYVGSSPAPPRRCRTAAEHAPGCGLPVNAGEAGRRFRPGAHLVPAFRDTVGQAVSRTCRRWAFEVFPQVTSTIGVAGPELIHERGEVRVLGHHHSAGVRARRERWPESTRSLQCEVADAPALDAQRRTHPRRECGRELIIEPDRHVTRRRWDAPVDGSRTEGKPTRPRAARSGSSR